MRKYRGYYDNGVRTGMEIEYYSKHRNRSKENMEDMKREAYNKYGKNSQYYQYEFGYIIENKYGKEV